MVASGRFVIGIIVLHEEGRVLRQRIHYTAAKLIASAAVIHDTLSVQCLAGGISGILIHGVKVAVGIDAAHIVHGHGSSGLHTGIDRRCVQRETTPTTDADDTNTLRINSVVQRQEIHRRLEILRIDIRRCHISGLTAALTSKGGIEGNRQKTPFRHRLGIQAGALLLHRAKGAAHGDGGQFSLCFFGQIHIRRQGDAITVYKSHLAMIHFFALGESLVPFLRQYQLFCLHHDLFLPFTLFLSPFRG